jgi:hypothetical protein
MLRVITKYFIFSPQKRFFEASFWWLGYIEGRRKSCNLTGGGGGGGRNSFLLYSKSFIGGGAELGNSFVEVKILWKEFCYL